jgi:acetyl-CoA carboxylase biotin carboxylase subunit
MQIKSILIANRGEIAVRIIKAAKKLGLKTVQVFSDVDKESLAVRLADQSIRIGTSSVTESYLNINKIVTAAKKTKVDAIHPGYGFLSENAAFADAVKKEGIIFIGPDGDIIRKLGDKVAARLIARNAGLPTVPGSQRALKNVKEAISAAKLVGYPVLVKALSGGGGKGIQIAWNEKELRFVFFKVSNEAKAIFGDGSLYLEKYISKARHIEVQVIGDGTNFVHCFERECSLQRRRQKIWEEAPAVNLPERIRKEMCEKAVSLVRAVKYVGVATVEYVYDDSQHKFYFIETNTRIQVEHPITEMITGVDLVVEMIKIASGIPLALTQRELKVNGHAIECRINAEDSENNFIPSPGIVKKIRLPTSNSIRFDTLLYNGYTIPVYYDSMIGKLIAHGSTREKAMSVLRNALKELQIDGIQTTIPLHNQLVNNDAVIKGNVDTQFLEKLLSN